MPNFPCSIGSSSFIGRLISFKIFQVCFGEPQTPTIARKWINPIHQTWGFTEKNTDTTAPKISTYHNISIIQTTIWGVLFVSPSTPITVTPHLICIKVWSSVRSGGSAGGPKSVKQICWEDESWMCDNEFTPATSPQDPRDPWDWYICLQFP